MSENDSISSGQTDASPADASQADASAGDAPVGSESADTMAARPCGPLSVRHVESEQKRALLLLVSGKSIQETAETMKIHRGTIYRWIKSSPRFRAAYNTWQLEQRESCSLKLLQCAQVAVKKLVERAEFDGALAFKIAREMGLFKHPGAMITEPDSVEREIQIEQLEEQTRLNSRELNSMRPAGSRFDNDPSRRRDNR